MGRTREPVSTAARQIRTVRAISRQLILFWLSSVAIFVVTRALPRTPMQVYLEQRGLPVTQQSLASLSQEWGLDGSPVHQYVNWITGFFTGNWGTSIASGTPVRHELLSRLPLSLTIGLGGVGLATFLALPLGMNAGLGRRGWSTFSNAVTLLSQAVPSFLVCTLIIDVLGVRLGLIPFYNLEPWQATIAPTLVVGLYSLGQLSRVTSAHVRQVLDEPYMVAAISRGFPTRSALWHDGWRPVAYGLLSTVISKMAWVIGGTAVVEYVFAVPGMSYYVISSISARDYQVVQSYLMLLVLWMFGVHLVIDFCLLRLDPRLQ